jgi:hypothetical protein
MGVVVEGFWKLPTRKLAMRRFETVVLIFNMTRDK